MEHQRRPLFLVSKSGCQEAYLYLGDIRKPLQGQLPRGLCRIILPSASREGRWPFCTCLQCEHPPFALWEIRSVNTLRLHYENSQCEYPPFALWEIIVCSLLHLLSCITRVMYPLTDVWGRHRGDGDFVVMLRGHASITPCRSAN